jgi:hypothetical protein
MNETKVPKVGDKIKTWFSGEPGGYSTILAVYPYYGRYTESFQWVIKATATKTRRGWLEMAISSSHLEYELEQQ